MRPPEGGRDDLLGEVMRKQHHRPDPSGSKQNLSRLAGSGGLYCEMIQAQQWHLLPGGNKSATSSGELLDQANGPQMTWSVLNTPDMTAASIAWVCANVMSANGSI